MTQTLKSQDSWALSGTSQGGAWREREGQVTDFFVLPCIELEQNFSSVQRCAGKCDSSGHNDFSGRRDEVFGEVKQSEMTAMEPERTTNIIFRISL